MAEYHRTLERLATVLRGEPRGITDWIPVLALANEFLLAPSLWSVLRTSGYASAVPPEVGHYLQTLHALNGERNAVIRNQILELVAALNAADIVPTLLKGALTLIDGPYGDPAARMMRDIDLLVPAASRRDSIAVLERLGYRLARGYGETHHAYGDFAREGDPAAVDLHTELVDPHYILSASEVRDRGMLWKADGRQLIVPCATDRVLHNFLHAQIHHLGHYYRGELQVGQLYEFAALAAHFGPAIDWRFIEQRLETHRLARPLRDYAFAARRLFGLPWPLSRPPTFGSALYYLRCQLQAGSTAAQQIGVIWGNLRGPLAWHRMRALYGADGSALGWRYRHIMQYLQREGPRASVSKLRRAE
jgi:hypothetical protein